MGCMRLSCVQARDICWSSSAAYSPYLASLVVAHKGINARLEHGCSVTPLLFTLICQCFSHRCVSAAHTVMSLPRAAAALLPSL